MGGELLGIVSGPGDYECPWELLFPAFPGAAGDPGFPALRVGQSSGRASRPVTALIVIVADIAWIVLSVALGFPGLGERVFQTLVAAVTLAMVFVIQHTQAREQAATQRKLDEILQALPGADNALLMLEHASHDELRATCAPATERAQARPLR
jgi:low affinity Fe/Cu permease